MGDVSCLLYVVHAGFAPTPSGASSSAVTFRVESLVVGKGDNGPCETMDLHAPSLSPAPKYGGNRWVY